MMAVSAMGGRGIMNNSTQMGRPVCKARRRSRERITHLSVVPASLPKPVFGSAWSPPSGDQTVVAPIAGRKNSDGDGAWHSGGSLPME